MMKLYLVQHGEAKTKVEDPDLPLTDRGRGAVEQVAVWAARAGVRVDQIRHSGRRRANQTAAILAQHLEPSEGLIAVSGLAPNDDVRPTANALQGETRTLMLVGHLPFLSRLAGLLLVGDPDWAFIQFRMGGIVCLVRENDQWAVDWIVTPELAAQRGTI